MTRARRREKGSLLLRWSDSDVLTSRYGVYSKYMFLLNNVQLAERVVSEHSGLK